jgi:hypothetical protein
MLNSSCLFGFHVSNPLVMKISMKKSKSFWSSSGLWKAIALLRKFWWLLLIVVLIGVYWFSQVGGAGLLKSMNDSDSYYADGKGGGYGYDYDYGGAELAYVEESMSMSVARDWDDGSAYVDYADESVEQKIIKTGSLDLHMEDVQESVDAVTEYVEDFGGAVTYSSVNRGDSSYYGYMTLKVPAEDFDEAMEGLRAMAEYVDYEYTNSEDVTETYMDYETRLANYEAEEAQYLEIMEMAENVEEVLSVTNALSGVRYEIEWIESQLSYYDTRVSYSTIDLTLTEDDSASAVAEKWRPLGTVRDAFSDFVAFLQSGVDTVIYAGIFLWPIALVGLVVWLVRRRK